MPSDGDFRRMFSQVVLEQVCEVWVGSSELRQVLFRRGAT